MKKYQLDLNVGTNVSVAGDAFLLELTSQDKLPECVPGQFVEVLVSDSPRTFLRRPISIHDIDRKNNTLYLLIRKVGPGTEKLSTLKQGDTVNVLMPLGNGFDYRSLPTAHPLLIGGGVGIAPLLLLGRQMAADGISPTFLFGGRSRDNLLRMDVFGQIGQVYATTEDNSFGQKGFVTNHTILTQERFDQIFACGPTPMMKAVARYAASNGIPCQVSLEHRMACGIGACLCCVEDTKDGNLCVCKEGPVFNIERLKWLD